MVECLFASIGCNVDGCMITVKVIGEKSVFDFVEGFVVG